MHCQAFVPPANSLILWIKTHISTVDEVGQGFTRQMPFLTYNQQRQSTGGRSLSVLTAIFQVNLG